MREKEPPGGRDIHNGSTDGFAVPVVGVPARRNMEDGDAGIIAGENGQLLGTQVEVFGEIAQADALGRNVVNPCGGGNATISHLDGGVNQLDAAMLPFINRRQTEAIRTRIIADGAEKGEKSDGGLCQSPGDSSKQPLTRLHR